MVQIYSKVNNCALDKLLYLTLQKSNPSRKNSKKKKLDGKTKRPRASWAGQVPFTLVEVGMDWIP